MVILHNDPNPKVRQNVEGQKSQKLQNERESTKKTLRKKRFFLRMVNNFLKNHSILIWFPARFIRGFNSAVLEIWGKYLLPSNNELVIDYIR